MTDRQGKAEADYTSRLLREIERLTAENEALHVELGNLRVWLVIGKGIPLSEQP